MNYDITFILKGLTKNNKVTQYKYEEAWWPFDFLPRKKERIYIRCIEGTISDIFYNVGSGRCPEIYIYIDKIINTTTIEELEEAEKVYQKPDDTLTYPLVLK